jgi:phosphoglucomutase
MSDQPGAALDRIETPDYRAAFNEALREARDPPDDATAEDLAVAGVAHMLSTPLLQQLLAEASADREVVLRFVRMLLVMLPGPDVSIIIDLPRDPRRGVANGVILHRVEQAYRRALDGSDLRL